MKKQAILALALSALLLLTACAGNAAKQEMVYAEEAAPAAAYDAAYEEAGYATSTAASGAVMNAPAAAPADGDEKPQTDLSVRKIIYNADMGITAEDPAAALSAIIEKANALGGYVADSYERTDDLGVYRASATIKAPADRLSELVSAAEGLGTVDSYQLSSDDISLSYYDIEARLKSAKAEEAQLLEILDQCESVEEVLAVRESLAAVRSDIESYQGQINLWDNLVSYATLTLSINRTPRPAVEGEGRLVAIWKASDVWKKMSLGFANSARFLVNAVGAVGIFLAYAILPAALIAAIAFGIIALNRKTKPARERRRAARLERKAKKAAERLEKKRNSIKRE